MDELENDEAGIAETYMDDNVVATAARPGTSLQRPMTSAKGPSPAVRPRTNSGRPLSGVVRPDTRLRTGTMEQALRTSRTSKTARAVSSSSARQVRLGTVRLLCVTTRQPKVGVVGVDGRPAGRTVRELGATQH